jgi:DHA3 family macrolide efflux protein-like MFS transporter
MKQTLWTRNFTRITAATTLGAAGGIISQFALSFLVFDETGSTLASALVVAIQLIPMVLLPLVVAPMMDRLPRKPFLVWGDLLNGLLRRGGTVPAAQCLLLHRLSGLFPAGIVPCSLR